MTSGPHTSDRYRLGDWRVQCSRSGFWVYASETVKEAKTGYRVRKDIADPPHPQDSVRGRPDDMRVPFANPPTGVWEDGTPVEFGREQFIDPTSPMPMFDFTGGSLPSGATFSRASSGTRFNSGGTLVTESSNVARFDYDPSTLVLLGLLIEPTRTNLLQNSRAIDVTPWQTLNATITANDTTGIDGDLVADRLTMAIDFSVARQTVTGIVPSGNYSLSGYFKRRATTSAHASNIRLTTNNALAWNTGQTIRFPLTTAYQKAVLSGQLSTGDQMICYFGSANIGSEWDSACLGHVDVDALQLETGLFATSFIETGTRQQDVLLLAVPGFSDGRYPARVTAGTISPNGRNYEGVIDVAGGVGTFAWPSAALTAGERHLRRVDFLVL